MVRKKIIAANWKMNCDLAQANQLLDAFANAELVLNEHKVAVFAVPFPYLILAKDKLAGKKGLCVAAQNMHGKKSGAYTGETSVDMLSSIGISHVIIGHSERREYFQESNQFLADKTKLAIAEGLVPIFCCGEPLEVREANAQNEYVAKQLEESLYGLSYIDFLHVVIAYEPIWAIGTGKTATSEQAQEMHAFIRSSIAHKYGKEVADKISILYGGSVKAANAKELFAMLDVDGGLVGGASLNATEFIQIINA